MSDTKSFETSLCELMGYFYDNSYVTRLCERIRRAHDREIRDVSQQQYDRGFHAGQHSMDAEHRAVAMRLRHLPLDGGSNENLSQIARAIYHSDWGWTKCACAALRDKLIDLMGGVSDDTCGAGCCCAAADCDGDCGLQREEVGHGGTAHDCADDSRGGSRGKLVHMDGLVAYDVLDNERRKAIAELRKLDGCSPTAHNFRDALAASVNVPKDGAPYDDKELCHLICDRLIHLLGGDQPSGIDVMREMAECEAECRITDELREWMSTVLTSDDYAWAIADRIDAQFDRICQQQEAVLQSTIDGVAQRLKDADKRLDDAAHDVEMWRDRAEDMRMERDELQAKLDAIRDALDG